MEVHIIGTPKEIAALVAALQERQDLQQAKDVANQIADMLTETASSFRTQPWNILTAHTLDPHKNEYIIERVKDL